MLPHVRVYDYSSINHGKEGWMKFYNFTELYDIYGNVPQNKRQNE